MIEFPPPSHTAAPSTADAVRDRLNEGNARFADWVSSDAAAADFETRTGLVGPHAIADHKPMAVVVGCSDARFPLRHAVGARQGEVFEIRVAGNVLADECLGSIDYALANLPTVRSVVVLGHTHCGAVTASVDGYLKPASIHTGGLTVGLRSIVHRLFPPVHQAELAMKSLSDPPRGDAMRKQLIAAAIYIHAAATAMDLQVQITQSGRTDVGVLHGVFDLRDYRIRSAGTGSTLQTGFGPAPPDAAAMQQIAAATAAAAGQEVA